MEYLLGIDVGTSGTKTVLFDKNGSAVASNTVEYPMLQPQNGWAEQKPDDWWNAVCRTTSEVVRGSGVNPSDIRGVGISGQMHGLVMLDENGEVIRNSIIWCDGRTAEECEEITETVGRDRLLAITANPALTGFTAGKILWVRKHEPQNYARCRHILLPKDYIRYKLTGEFATEVSDASGMNLLDVPNRCWSDEILNALDIDKKLLGKMYESCEITGYVTQSASGLCALAAGTPVVGGAGDNAAAAIGTGVVSSGKAFTTLGTSGVVFAHSDKVTIDPKGRVHTFCSAVPKAWTVMSCTLAAGLSLRWFRDTFCEKEIADGAKEDVDPYVLMDKLAAESPIGANRLLFLPYLMGERSPILDEKARGAFIGLSAMHQKGDLIRSVMEGVAFSQRSCLDVFEEMDIAPNEMMACGGGARSAFWRKILADVYGCTVKTVSSTKEGPALGVAILAGVGTGVYSSVQQACELIVRADSNEIPDKQNTEKYEEYYEIYKELYPSLKLQYAKLAKI
ncbi:MAG: xylulokinase [Oscillospiraceae bacterium]